MGRTVSTQEEGIMSRFDEVIDRHGTGSLKWDANKNRHVPESAISMWVADMDFRVPDPVAEALHKAVTHGIFGYSDVDEEYAPVVCKWFEESFGASVEPEWIVRTPGVVFAINAAIHAYTMPGDGVLIQKPVYYPFAASIIRNNRKVVNNELIYHNGVYSIDFTDFEEKIVSQQVKLFILCSPHNPVGRVWSREELSKMAEICIRHHVFVVSDEIHCDFTGNRFQHIMFQTLSEQAAKNCIVCTSPSKTFNLAGLQISNIFVPDENRREALRKEIAATGYDESNLMGIVACKAAYQGGREWLSELKEYLLGNLDYVRSFLKERLPMLHLVEPQGTYLIWIDFSELSMSDAELKRFIIHEAGLWLDGGSMFGEKSGQFQRFNIACPRKTLKKAFEQLADAVDRLRPAVTQEEADQ